MTRVTCSLTISLDGYVAGPDQSLESPLGVGFEEAMHGWMGDPDNAPEKEALTQAGAYVLGRNMFGPIRGEWDEDWRGWWGDNPPYHAPVFVLTHHPREPLELGGGTTFHFVTDGIESALRQASAATQNDHVDIAGGASTARQYLQAGSVDELSLQWRPLLMGAGERLFDGLEGVAFELVSSRGTGTATHVTYRPCLI